MPTYQYSCTDCGHFFEAVQSFSEDSLTVCPECEGRLRKVFNAVGVVFKGSGFYRTDSRSQPGQQGQQDGAGGTKDGTGTTGESSTAGGAAKEAKETKQKSSSTSSSSSSSSSTPSPAA